MVIEIDDYRPSSEIDSQLAGSWFVGVIGAGAVGKNTVARATVEQDERFHKIVSGTTRKIRLEDNEIEGEDYFFHPNTLEFQDRLEKRIVGGEVVQAATDTTGTFYYWSEVEQWTKKPFPIMDIWKHEYERPGFKELALRGRTAIMLVCPPEDLWLPRFNKRYPVGSKDRKTRLIEANRVLNWAKTQDDKLFWVPNMKVDGGDFAASKIIEIALDDSGTRAGNYALNDYAKSIGDKMINAIQRELGNKKDV